MSGRRLNAEYPLRSGLWHPLNVSLPPRPPPSGGLQHGVGPAGCAVLLKARFDRRLDCCPSGDVGGEEGCVADRASAMLEPPLGGGRVPRLQSALRQSGRDEEAELCEAAARQGSGEWNIQRMPEAASEGVFGSRYSPTRWRRHMKNRPPKRCNARRHSFLCEQRAPTDAWDALQFSELGCSALCGPAWRVVWGPRVRNSWLPDYPDHS